MSILQGLFFHATFACDIIRNTTTLLETTNTPKNALPLTQNSPVPQPPHTKDAGTHMPTPGCGFVVALEDVQPTAHAAQIIFSGQRRPENVRQA
jgi:hypothetical protein